MVLTRSFKNEIRTLINFSTSHNNVGPPCKRRVATGTPRS